MKIQVKTRHMESSDAITQYVEDKCPKLTRYYDGVNSIEVILDHEADHSTVEVVVHASPRQTFVAKVNDDDMYACIDHCIDKVAQQLRKYKDKIRNHKVGPAPVSDES